MKCSSVNEPTTPPKDPLLARLVIRYPAFQQALDRLQECFDYAATGQGLCTACFDPTGSGKTQLARSFASLHPHYDGPSGSIMPVVYVRLPSGLSMKQAAEEVLKALNYPMYMQGNAYQKTDRIIYFIKKCQVRMLILDETNHFVDSRMGIEHDAADWLKNLIQETKISVVLLGIERSIQVLLQDEQLQRRFSAPFTLGRFLWTTEDGETAENDGNEYMGLLEKFSEADDKVRMDMHILRDPDLAYRLFCASSGSVGYTAKFLEAAMIVARREGRSCLDQTHFLKGFMEAQVQEGAPVPNPFDPDITPEPLNYPAVHQSSGGRAKRRK